MWKSAYHLPIFCLLIFSTSTFGQATKDKFDKAILLLSSNKTQEASLIYEGLYKQDSTNMNLAYHLGQCYAILDTNLEYSIYLLNKALKDYSPDYKKRSANERRVSEYAYYYLLMAYSKNGECDKTLETLHNFYRIYSYENEWYLIDGQELHHTCEQREIPIVEKEADALAHNDSTSKEAWTPKEKRHIIGTKRLQYTTKAPLWGIQIGSSLEPQFTYEYKGVKNVNVYVDKNGVYRYIIGKFIHHVQAERLLQKIVDAGYPDAFIVNVREKNKFSEQVVTIDNESISKKLVGKVDFRVQIGAFRGDTIPNELIEIYLKLENISETQQGELTLLTVGSFKTVEEAEFLKELVKDVGVADAFVVAFNYNRKVNLKQAIYYLEEQERIKKKRSEKNKKK